MKTRHPNSSAFFQLAGGHFRKLQGNRGEGHEPVGTVRADRRELFVLNLDHLLCQVAVERIPGGINTERLHVRAPFGHAVETFGQDERGVIRCGLRTHQGGGLGRYDVRVNIDGLHAAASHHHLSAFRRVGRLRAQFRVTQTTAGKYDSGGRRRIFEELPATGHDTLQVMQSISREPHVQSRHRAVPQGSKGVAQPIVFRGLLSPTSAQTQTTEDDRPRHLTTRRARRTVRFRDRASE
jgi:hypothetical protein